MPEADVSTGRSGTQELEKAFHAGCAERDRKEEGKYDSGRSCRNQEVRARVERVGMQWWLLHPRLFVS